MVKDFCDICGQEIKANEEATRWKLKKEWHSWYEYGWERLHVHNDCWLDMCQYIRERRKSDGREEGIRGRS